MSRNDLDRARRMIRRLSADDKRTLYTELGEQFGDTTNRLLNEMEAEIREQKITIREQRQELAVSRRNHQQPNNGIMLPYHEMTIRADERRRYFEQYNGRLDAMGEAYNWFTNLETTMNRIDYGVFIDRHAFLLKVYEGADRQLLAAFKGVRAAVKVANPALESRLETLKPEIIERAELVENIVVILKRPELKDWERSRLIKPLMERLREIAADASELRADLVSIRKEADYGGRGEGMSAERKWLLERWLQVADKFKQSNIEARIQRMINVELPTCNLEASEQKWVDDTLKQAAGDPQWFSQFMRNLKSEHSRRHRISNRLLIRS